MLFGRSGCLLCSALFLLLVTVILFFDRFVCFASALFVCLIDRPVLFYPVRFAKSAGPGCG